MDKNKLIVETANTGEVLLCVGACVWLVNNNLAQYVFALGTLLFAIGRFAEKHPDTDNIALKRLYVQRTIGIVILIIAALLMFFYKYINGYEISDYVLNASASAWLLPFVIFVVIELYTAFRIPYELKKEEQ